MRSSWHPVALVAVLLVPACQSSTTTGNRQMNNNTFDGCRGSTTSTAALTPPYALTPDPVANLPTAIPAGAGVGKS